MGMGQAGTILIEPDDGPSIGTDERNGSPEVVQEGLAIRVVTVENAGTPKTNVPSFSIALQVDDLEMTHRFRVLSPGTGGLLKGRGCVQELQRHPDARGRQDSRQR
jgi:hypothetical protein